MTPGVVVGGKYRLVRLLGQGAMGEVWAAVNEATGGEVALKLLSRPREELRHRLLREGAIVQRLARDDKRMRVRYVGALEVEGWIPADVIVDERRLAKRINRYGAPSRLRPTHVFPGSVVRREPRWGADHTWSVP